MPKESTPLIKRSVTEKGYFAYVNVAFVADQIRESRHETESRGNPGRSAGMSSKGAAVVTCMNTARRVGSSPSLNATVSRRA
jgi:hypothetical protein